MQYMRDFAARLEETGEFVDAQALSPEGAFVRYDGEGRPPVTDGPFAETKDLIAGWMIIDVESWDRAVAAGRGAVRRSRGRRQADPRVARGAAVPHRAAHGDRVNEPLLRELVPAVIGVLVRRGADFASAEDAVQEALIRALETWPDDPPRDPKAWLVAVAWRKFLDAARAEASRRGRELAVRGRAARRPGARHRRHAAALLPVRAPDPARGLGRRPDAARGRRPDHAADRDGVPRPRGDHGAADQPGQAADRGAAARPARRSRDGAAGALPRLQRGVRRGRRPGGRGDPPHPPARRPDRRARGRGAARAHAAAPRAPRVPHRPGRSPGAARPSRTGRAGTPA